MFENRRLAAILAAVAMITANISSAAVYADDALTESENYIQENTLQNDADFNVNDDNNTESVENTSDDIYYQIEENAEHSEENTAEAESQEASENSPDLPENTQISDAVEDDNPSGGGEAMAVTNGQGDIEGLVNTKVFQVNLPVKSHLTDYVADPQRLIKRTDAARHPDSVYDEDANVFFFNGEKISEDGTKKKIYSSRSDSLLVTNKSSCPVNVVARVSAYYEQDAVNPVSVSPDREWEGEKKPGIWLAVINDSDETQVVLSQKEQVVTASIAGCPGAYRYVYEDNGTGESEYNYRLMSDRELEIFRNDAANEGIDTEFKSFSLSMTGECNPEADWDDRIDYDFPSTSIIWNVGVAVSVKPFINNTEYTVAYGRAVDIPYSLGLFNSSASEIISAEFIPEQGEKLDVRNNEEYFSCTDSMIYVTSGLARYARNSGGGILKIGFDDPERTITDIILDANAAPSVEESEITISDDDNKITVMYELGAGEKAATAVSSVSFGNTRISSSEYSDSGDGKIVLNATAVRTIKSKNGGNIYLSFNDTAHTRQRIKISVG